MITFTTPKHHWNYFLAIEKDLENLSKYVEFCEDNISTYSIALAHILLSASSEVDVIMKQLCALVDDTSKTENFDEYRLVIKDKLSTLIYEEVTINRYGMTFTPWDNWIGDKNPDWWKGYNKVKHYRNSHFKEANLKNTLNAVAALLISVVYYYKVSFSKEANQEVSFKDTTAQFASDAVLMEMNSKYYWNKFLV